MAKQVLIVESERMLAKTVSLELRQEGYEVDLAFDGRSGWEATLVKDYDLVLLDVLLPEMDGFELTRRLQREKYPYIIMMTARDSVMDIVTGLDRGADGYIVKPFAIEELLARVRAVFRRQDVDLSRHQVRSNTIYRDLTLNPVNRTVLRGDKQISLSKREFDLLSLLLNNLNKVMTREMILGQIWHHHGDVRTNVVDVYVRYLRGKLDIPGQESYIQTVRGMGYLIRGN